jgi:hypothetical protein
MTEAWNTTTRLEQQPRPDRELENGRRVREDHAMESMPFFHANQIFTLFFVEDLTFVEVRAVLDQLIDQDAFNAQVQQHKAEYCIHVESVSFHVWVDEMKVVIRREECL